MAGLNRIKYELSLTQLQILKSEINTDPQGKGYAGETTGGINFLINEAKIITNPTPQPDIIQEEIPTDRVLNVLEDIEVQAIKAHVSGSALWNILLQRPGISLTSNLVTKIFTALVTDSVIDLARVNVLKNLSKTPDPSWPANIRGNSRAEVVLGGTGVLPDPAKGIMIEGADIKAAMAL